MRKSTLQSYVSFAVLSISSMMAVPALAADATTGASADDGLDTIVVTAAAGDKTKLKSSISVTSVSNQAIMDFTPRSEAEVLRSIPGLNLQDTAGPGGNANIGVRGLPVSTGGSEYVALQEDGLPVTLFGDIQFGNNDYWLRFDNSVDRVEAVRGGSSSTFASQAPGAVINYVSKTGDKEGGAVGISTGVNYREQRVDFNFGTRINDTLRFHVGGFVKDGNGPTHIGYTASKGYQIKANITQDFDDGKGYIRFSVKRLDAQDPTFTSMPSLAQLSGTKITGFKNIPGIDARKYASTGAYNHHFTILNAEGNLEQVEMQGIHPVSTAFGNEFHYEFNDNLTVHNAFRWTDMRGTFSNMWTGEAFTATAANGGSFKYAAGPLTGQTYNSTYINNSAQAYVRMKDVGSLANDLKITGKFETSGARVTVNTGVFFMRQSIAMDWRINNAYQTLDGNHNPVPLDLFDAGGNQLTANGLTGFNNQWGGCCGGRSYDLTYTDIAPYLNVDTKIGELNLDASVRFDSVKATGGTFAPVAGANITVTDALGSASLPTYNTSSTLYEILDYTKSYVSWSFGALYEVDNDTSAFIRVSRGGRFNADRLIYGKAFNSDGSLSVGGNKLSVNYVTQQELGIKKRGRIGDASFNAELTLYRAQVTENNYDFTAPSLGRDPNISATFHSYGAEFASNLRYGNFSLVVIGNYNRTKDITNGATPGAQPKLTYRISPSYDTGVAAIGFTADGQTSSLTGMASASGDPGVQYNIPGQTYFNAFVKVRPYTGLELGMNVNNLFNTLGYRGNGGIVGDTIRNGAGVFDNSAMLGRTISASLKYKF